MAYSTRNRSTPSAKKNEDTDIKPFAAVKPKESEVPSLAGFITQVGGVHNPKGNANAKDERGHVFHPIGGWGPDPLTPKQRQEIWDAFELQRAKYPLLFRKLTYPFGPESPPNDGAKSGRRYLVLDIDPPLPEK